MSEHVSPHSIEDMDSSSREHDPESEEGDVNMTARFAAETVIITVSILVNIFGLVVVRMAHRLRNSVYHILYVNLAVSNILSCPATWLCNNIPFLFSDWFEEVDPEQQCRAVGYNIIGVYVALAVGIQMTFAMLGLTMVQYMAICHPNKSEYLLQKRRVFIFISGSALVTLVCIAVPFTTMLLQTRECGDESDDVINTLYRNTILIANILTGLITLQYIAITVITIRVFCASRSTAVARYDLHRGNGERELSDAFKTTMIMLILLTIFFIPFTIFFVYRLNVDGIEKVSANIAIYYLTMMPCAKCIFDPFIYILGTRHVLETASDNLCKCCADSWYAGRSGSDAIVSSSECDTDLNPIGAESNGVLNNRY